MKNNKVQDDKVKADDEISNEDLDLAVGGRLDLGDVVVEAGACRKVISDVVKG